MGSDLKRFSLVGSWLAIVLAACGLVLLPASPASAAAADPAPSVCPPDAPPSYPPGACRLDTDRTTVEAGDQVNVSGCGFKQRSRLALVLKNEDLGGHSRSLGTKRADEAGCIDGPVTIKRNTDPGTYRIRATGKDADNKKYRLVSDPITVTPSEPTSVVNTRASGVGSEGSAVGLAVGLLVVGSLFVRRSRRAA